MKRNTKWVVEYRWVTARPAMDSDWLLSKECFSEKGADKVIEEAKKHSHELLEYRKRTKG